jgi:transglutaminase-like putative cysteine protease
MKKPVPFDRFFRLLTYLLVACGFSMLLMAQQISPPAFWLFVIPFGVSFSPRVAQHAQLTLRQANMLTWLYVPVFLADTFMLSKAFVSSTIHLILFVQLVKIYQSKTSRDYFYLMLLSLLEVLASSSLTISTAFSVLFLLFLFVAIAALICFEMKRSAGHWATASESAGTTTDRNHDLQNWLADVNPSTQRIAIRAILSIALVSLVVISFLGTALFFAIPRFGSGYFSRTMGRTLRLSGFSDQIRLGSIGAIQLDPTVVMRVKIGKDVGGSDGLRWRGITLDYFDGRNWSKRLKGSAHSFPAAHNFKVREQEVPGLVTEYQVLLEACSTPYLFTLDRVLSVKGSLDSVVFDPVDDSIMARPHDYYRLIYQADSLLSNATPPVGRDVGLSPQARQAYLQTPDLDRRIPELAAFVTQRAQSAPDKAALLENYLLTRYRYSLKPSQIEDPKPIATFLFETKEGHCEYFASAMVVMLRTLGVPSRIVNGFRSGEYNEVGGNYIIRGRNAHSWVEAYVSDGTWRSYDPTPASSDLGSRNFFSEQVSHYLDAFELFWGEWILGYDEITQVSLFKDLQINLAQWADHSRYRLYREAMSLQRRVSWLGREVALFQTPAGWKLSFAVLVVGIGGWLTLQWLRRLGRRWHLNQAIRRGDGSPAIQLYEEMLKLLHSRGKVKPVGTTPKEFVGTFDNLRLREQVGRLTDVYNAVRFSKGSINLAQMCQAYDALVQIKTLTKEGVM